MIGRGTRLSNNGHPMVENGKPLNFISGKLTNTKSLVYAEDKAYLDKAKEYLDANDYKACAVYLRTAFEMIIEEFCENKHLPVKYRRDPNKQDTQEFLGCDKN